MGAKIELTCVVQGFITACVSGDGEALKICQMPMRMHLDTPWPMQKIPLRATPLRIAYFAEARLYVILTSRPVCFLVERCTRTPLLLLIASDPCCPSSARGLPPAVPADLVYV